MEDRTLCPEQGPYRPNVAALIIQRHEHGVDLLLGERRDTSGCWQWPQGGVDPGESPEQALLREVREETGLKSFHVLYRFPHTLTYRFPEGYSTRFRPYIGQEQTYFIIQPKPKKKPDLDKATDKEFRELKWIPIQDAHLSAVWFKQAVYDAALSHAKKVLSNWGWL